MITKSDLIKLGFSSGEFGCNDDFRHPSNLGISVSVDPVGVIFMRTSDNYHGLGFDGIKDINDFIKLWGFITNEKL